MKRKPRIYYSDSQKALMWERWRQGDSLQKIAQLFDRNHSSVERILAETGGIRPAQRCRSRLALTLAEREEISRAVVAGKSIRCVAASLGRAPSTVSREVRRNGGLEGYRASQADQRAWDRARRPKPCKLVVNRKLADIVASKLKLQWSPEQIAGWLKQAYASDEDYHVSHETIYRSLYIQARGALKKEVLEHLRRSRNMRQSRHHTQKRTTMAGSTRRYRSASVLPALRIVPYPDTGGRSAFWQPQQPDCHPGRAPDALRHARKNRW
jgi:DNA-binding CsgD family transcriptional regulator